MFESQKISLAIIGLGYVGLPLATLFSTKYKVFGFDSSKERITSLKSGFDKTNEVSSSDFINENLTFTYSSKDISKCNVFIVTVPTPIDANNKPDLNPLKKASESVGKVLKKNDYVIFESTVYPGVTEDICGKILENVSRLKVNKDFFLGYSPERINPGDKKRSLQDIVKITSGSTKKASEFIDKLYSSIIVAGTHKAESIIVAEAAKVIENTQRDLNIALINEISLIFNKLNINTNSVLDAANTKWNFLDFKPGLVGGHCIGVDPYYLTHRAKEVGHNPKVILAGRQINDGMPIYIANKMIKNLKKNSKSVKFPKILIMGLTFKENCPDIRNSKVFNIIDELKKSEVNVDVYDPLCSEEDVSSMYHLETTSKPPVNEYDGIIIAVAHQCFKDMGIEKIKNYGKPEAIVFDLKGIFNKEDVNFQL